MFSVVVAREMYCGYKLAWNQISNNDVDILEMTLLFAGQLCKARPCTKGGNCFESNNTRWCECLPGYIGNDCETGERQR